MYGNRQGGKPTGTGPFVLDSTEANRSATFKRNPAYFKKSAAGTSLPNMPATGWKGIPKAAARSPATRLIQACSWTRTRPLSTARR